MMLPKIRELGEAIKSMFSRPFTTAFPFKKTFAAAGYRGKPEFSEADCVGCKACAEVCPSRAIEVIDDIKSLTRTLIHHQDMCVFCQQCERACITEKGIKLTTEFDLATYNRFEAITKSVKKLILCDNCNEIIGALDHLRFLSWKVGPLLYTNPTLLMTKHKELGLLNDTKSLSENKRAGHLQVLCPNCRREIIITEQW